MNKFDRPSRSFARSHRTLFFAAVVGDAVVVSSPSVPEPVAARYAWQANPLATLFNAAGLPAAPFRTDDWAFSDVRP